MEAQRKGNECKGYEQLHIRSDSEMKLLGVTFDERLMFGSYIDYLSKRASRKVGILIRLINLLPTLAKLRIYKTFIMPQLTYCQTVWHFYLQGNRW